MRRQVLRLAGRVVRGSSVARRVVGSALDLQARRVIAQSGLFVQDWYAAQAGRRFASAGDALDHYVRTGRSAGLSPHPLYEAEWHLRHSKRTEQALREPFALFLQQARRSTTSPHPLFDTRTYVESRPAATHHPYGAFGHFCANATPDTPLPLPPSLDGFSITWGEWRDVIGRHIETWRRQNSLTSPPRLTDHFDRAAQREFRASIAGRIPRPDPEEAPLVTVVTPVRNRAQRVLEAIASVQAQTLRDWEMIVVDDGSTDATYDAVAEVAKREPRLTLVRIEPGGVCRARNEGIARARGRYVAWLDSDNTWQPDFLHTMIAAMQARNSRAAYAALEFHTGGRSRYFQFPGGVDHLAVHNHVDLNVLVVERALLDEVGGFDESLRRAVDYDLVFRIAKRTHLDYLPFIGAVYQDDDLDSDRISVREPHSWNYVVRDRHVVDWERVAAGVSARDSERVSVVIATRNHWMEAWRTTRSVVEESAGDSEVVVVDNASSRMDSLLTAAAELINPAVRVVRNVANYNRGPGRNVGFAHSTGGQVIFIDDLMDAPAGWLGPLLEALRDPETLAAQPLVVHPEGRIHNAGAVFPAHGTLPLPFLAGHPVQDASRLGAVVDPPALMGPVLALRAADMAALRGFDPLYVDALEDVDLCLRLRALRPGRFALITASVVKRPERMEATPTSKRAGQRAAETSAAAKPAGARKAAASGKTRAKATSGTAVRVALQDRRVFVDRWSRRTPAGAETLYGRAGFHVSHYRIVDDETYEDVPSVRPVLVRERGRAADGPATGLPALRWAVEAPDPTTDDDPVTAFAVDICDRLRRWGQDASVRRRSGSASETDYLDDVVLALAGEPTARPGRVNLLWVLDPATAPDAPTVRGFDVVLTPGGAWSFQRAGDAHVVVEALDPAATAQSADDDPRIRRLVELATQLWKAES